MKMNIQTNSKKLDDSSRPKKEIPIIKEKGKNISAWRTSLRKALVIGEKSGFIKNFDRAETLNKIHAKYLSK